MNSNKMALRCPNRRCERFNQELPGAALYCPMCATVLGNAVLGRPQGRDTPALRPLLVLNYTQSDRQICLRGQTLDLGRETTPVARTPGRQVLDLGSWPGGGTISRQHARLGWSEADRIYAIVDLGSSNGTYVNGHALTPGQIYQLVDGDRLQLGRSDLLTFEVRITPVAARA